jgi:hypothetical protein
LFCSLGSCCTFCFHSFPLGDTSLKFSKRTRLAKEASASSMSKSSADCVVPSLFFIRLLASWGYFGLDLGLALLSHASVRHTRLGYEESTRKGTSCATRWVVPTERTLLPRGGATGEALQDAAQISKSRMRRALILGTEIVDAEVEVCSISSSGRRDAMSCKLKQDDYR